jgi:hypothetical protein
MKTSLRFRHLDWQWRTEVKKNNKKIEISMTMKMDSPSRIEKRLVIMTFDKPE